MIFRMQDKDGRGPWKPGFSETWIDPERTDYSAPTVMEDFGASIIGQCRYYQAIGYHVGVGCSDETQLEKWFSEKEKDTLRRLGYNVVQFSPTHEIARSKWQVVFAHKTHLKFLSP
jgi:hypothetical protein